MPKDINMLHVFDNAIRGGVTTAAHQLAKPKINACLIIVNEKKNDTLSVLFSTNNTDRFYKNKLLSLNLNLLKISSIFRRQETKKDKV